MPYKPIQQQLLNQLLEVLASGLNAELERTGHAPLDNIAFMPVKPGELAGDTVAVSYLGTSRSDEKIQHRDNVCHFAIGIWAFGASDQLAQAKAIACEFAVSQLLDDPANRYLGGLAGSPILIRDSQVVDISESEAGMLWRIAMTIECPVRTTRPEQTR